MPQDPLAIPEAYDPEFRQYPTLEEYSKQKYQESVQRAQVASTDLGDLVSNAVKETWALSPWFSEAHSANFTLDPAWAPNEEQRLRALALPEAAVEDALYAKSEPHFNAIMQDLQDRQQMQGMLVERFGPATLIGSYLGAAILDPVNIAMMAATGPTYTAIAQSGKFAMGARFLRTGALAATEAVAWGAMRQASGDILLDTSDIVTIGALGGVLGGGFGVAFGKYAPGIAHDSRALQLATDGATISEKGFLATQRGQGRWWKSPFLDDQATMKYRPHRLEADNHRPYGGEGGVFLSAIGTRERGFVGVSIAKSSTEEMTIMSSGHVGFKNAKLTMSGHMDADGVIRFNVDSIRYKDAGARVGAGLGGNPRDIEKWANRTLKEFAADVDSHGLRPRWAETAAPAQKLIPEVHPDEAASMLNSAGKVLDGEGNASIPGASAITIESRVEKMIQEHGLGILMRGSTSAGKAEFIAAVRHISENMDGGKKLIESLPDLRVLAEMGPARLRAMDPKTLRREITRANKDATHASSAAQEAAHVVSVSPVGQHFKGTVLEEAHKLSRDPNSDVHLVWMTPEEFSGFTIPLKPGVLGDKGESVESLVELLKGGTKLNDIPTLTIVPAPKREHGVFEVIRHNGRHRAEAFRELGITEIPVLIKGGEGSSIKGSSIASLSVKPPSILRNERGFGQKAFKDIVQEDHPFPINQTPHATFAALDEAAQAARREAALAHKPKLTITKSRAIPAPEDPSVKAPRRIATEYTATIHAEARKVLSEGDIPRPIPKEVRVTVRTKEEGLNEWGGKYEISVWGETIPVFAKNKKELLEGIHNVLEKPFMTTKLAKELFPDEPVAPKIPEVPPLMSLSRPAASPDEMSGFVPYGGTKELTRAEIQRAIHEADPATKMLGEATPYYHGTTAEFSGLPEGHKVFITPSRDWAHAWAARGGKAGRVIEIIITPKNVFDGQNPKHVRLILEEQLATVRRKITHAEKELKKARAKLVRSWRSRERSADFRTMLGGYQADLTKMLRAMETDEGLVKWGKKHYTHYNRVEDLEGTLKKLGFDAAWEIEGAPGVTQSVAWNIGLFDPKNQMLMASKVKKALMPDEVIAAKRGHLQRVEELETIIEQVHAKHPKHAETPEWQGFLETVTVYRSPTQRPKWQRSIDPDDVVVDVPPIKKQPTVGEPFTVPDPRTGKEVPVSGVMFTGKTGSPIFLSDAVFVHNARTGLDTSLNDIVDGLRSSADEVVAETARQENKIFNTRNMDAFRGTAAKGGDDAAKSLDLDAGFKEAGAHGPTLGGPGTRVYNSRKTQLQNTMSDAFNWVSLHVFGNQAGAETRAGKIIPVIDDADSWLRLGVSIDRDNLGVSLASNARKVVKQNLKEWKRETRQSFGDIFTRRSRATFRRDVARVLRNNDLLSADPNTLSKADQIVQRTAQEYSATFKKTLAWLKKHDPDGPWAGIPENANYFPRLWSENGHARLVKEFSVSTVPGHGEAQVQELIAKALRQGTRDGAEPMSHAQSMRFAELYLKRVGSNKFQMSWLNHPKWGRKDPKKFMQMLMDELLISEEEAMRFTSLFAKKVDDGTHGKFRVRLDENTTMTMRGADGQTRTVSFDELLNNDVVGVTDRYLHNVLSTAAEREVVRIFSDRMGLEGVFKSMDDLRPHLLNDLVEKGTRMADAEEMFENMLRELRGTPHTDSTVFAQNARMVRDANYSLGAGASFGLAALGDAFNAMFTQGGKNALQAIGVLKKMTKSGQRIDIDDDMEFLLEACALSDRKLDAMKANPIIDELGDLPGVGGKTAETLRQAATTMSDISGINAITTNAEKLALKIHALKYIRQMLDGETPNDVRLAQMGYTPEAWARDAAYMRRHARRYVGEDGVETVKPNFGEWADNQQGVRRFTAAMESEVTSHVVRADMNDLPAFFHKSGFSLALSQLLLQFRNFGITATRSMLVRNVKANDARSYITFLSAVVGGGLVYTIKQRIRHADDEEAFLESMQWDRWAQGAMSNSAIGATMELGDALKALVTGEGMTGHRWAPSDRFLGDVPTARTADALFRTAGIPFKAMQGKELTPGDFRALQDISLIGNHPLVRIGKNAIQTQEN